MSWKGLAAGIIESAVSDYRELEREKLITRGSVKPLALKTTAYIAWFHTWSKDKNGNRRAKDIGYIRRKLTKAGLFSCGVPEREILDEATRVINNGEFMTLNKPDMAISDASSAVGFFDAPAFAGLCEFVGLNPEAVKDKVTGRVAV